MTSLFTLQCDQWNHGCVFESKINFTFTRHKGQCHDIQWFFALFFARAKNGGCSRKCHGHRSESLAVRAAWQPGHLRWLLTWQCREPKTSRARVALFHLSTATVLLFSGYEARARWYPLLQGSRLAATTISVSILYSGVWFCAPSEACFGDLVAESMGDWEKESAVWSQLPFQWLWRCVSHVKANALNKERVRGTDVAVRANTGFVVAFAQYVTKTWRLKKRTCGKLRGRSARRQRTFEGDAQGPCMSSVQLLSARRRTFEHCTSCCPSRDATMVVLTKKKKRRTPLYHSTKKIFWGSVPTLEARCSLKSAVWRRMEWVHQSANDKTTTWAPSCRLSVKKLLRSAWPRSELERGHHSAVRGLPMNFRDLSWWPPLFFPTQNG